MLRARLVVVAFALGAFACRSAESSEPDVAPSIRTPRREQGAASEPVSVALGGGRQERIACVLGCDDTRDALGALRRRCTDDPRSAPRALDADPAMVAFGCCTDALRAYRAACGVEALEACVSRWIAECESGRLSP